MSRDYANHDGGERRCTECRDTFNLEEGGQGHNDAAGGPLCIRCEDAHPGAMIERMTTRTRDAEGHYLTEHGGTGTPLHDAWRRMLTRCQPSYADARPGYAGVTLDDRWSTFEGFVANPPPGQAFEPGLHLCRTGDSGPYSPENCRWDTADANRREANERRMLRLPDGRFAADVAREHNVPKMTWHNRIKAGWDALDAVTAPRYSRKP